jgi:hypothetical protein
MEILSDSKPKLIDELIDERLEKEIRILAFRQRVKHWT